RVPRRSADRRTSGRRCARRCAREIPPWRTARRWRSEGFPTEAPGAAWRREACRSRFDLLPPLTFGDRGAQRDEEWVHLLGLEMVLDELLRILRRRAGLQDFFLEQVFEHLLIDGTGVPVEAHQHDVRLDKGPHLREVAEELPRIPPADVAASVQAQRVLFLEDRVQRGRDQLHALLDLRVALAEQVLDLELG